MIRNPLPECVLMVCVVGCALAALVRAEQSGQRVQNSAPSILYRPPNGATEKTRVDGPLRGDPKSWPAVYVLSPEHTGLTTQEQPSLFYYLERPAGNLKMVLTVLKSRTPKPVLEVELDPSKAGVQRLDLAAHECKLESGQEYQWVVALVPDLSRRREGVTSSASVQRVDPSPALINTLQGVGSTVDRAVIYARNGIWYDALGAISDQIDLNPNDSQVRGLRAALCNQASLSAVAAYDSAAGNRPAR